MLNFMVLLLDDALSPAGVFAGSRTRLEQVALTVLPLFPGFRFVFACRLHAVAGTETVIVGHRSSPPAYSIRISRMGKNMLVGAAACAGAQK
jgi:hypothetical protein